MFPALRLIFSFTMRLPPGSTLFPYTTLFRSGTIELVRCFGVELEPSGDLIQLFEACWDDEQWRRSEEHRLNSSHITISYAVFCLKKKKLNNPTRPERLFYHDRLRHIGSSQLS